MIGTKFETTLMAQNTILRAIESREEEIERLENETVKACFSWELSCLRNWKKFFKDMPAK